MQAEAKAVAHTVNKHIRIDEELWQRLEEAARELGTTANRLLAELAERWLEKRAWPTTEADVHPADAVARAKLDGLGAVDLRAAPASTDFRRLPGDCVPVRSFEMDHPLAVIDARDAAFVSLLDPEALVRAVERDHVTGGIVRRESLLGVGVAPGDQPLGVQGGPQMRPSRASRSRMWALIPSRSSWLGAITPVRPRSSGESPSQRAATAPAMFRGFTSATLAPSFSNALPMSPARVASTAALSPGSRWRMISSITAVFMPACCSCVKGLPASTASNCFASPISTSFGMRSSPAILSRSRAWTVEARGARHAGTVMGRYGRGGVESGVDRERLTQSRTMPTRSRRSPATRREPAHTVRKSRPRLTSG